MRWCAESFNDLTPLTLYRILQLRSQTFVVEQGCSYLDADDNDLAEGTYHLQGYSAEGELVAYARLLPPPVIKTTHVVIGRVVVAASARQQGLGHELMTEALRTIAQRWPQWPIYVSAQAHLVDFYAQHGFNAVGKPYLDVNILHQGMAQAALQQP